MARSKGDDFECRVARLAHFEGYSVRRGIDLRIHFGDQFTVTDIDVFGVRFAGDLSRRLLVLECKSGEGKNAPRAGDRLLWSSGIRDLVSPVEAHGLATARQASEGARALAARLGATLMDGDDIARRESALGLEEGDLSGPHDPALLQLQQVVERHVRRDDELRRVWNFVRADAWFLPASLSAKRAISALRLVVRRWHPGLPDSEARSLQWLAEEAVGSLIVSVVDLSASAYQRPEPAFAGALLEELTQGALPMQEQRTLARRVDSYIAAVLHEAGLDAGSQLDRMGALDPAPPSYADSLIELIARFGSNPKAAADTPRLYDEELAQHRGSRPSRSAVPSAQRTSPLQLLQLLSQFLRGQLNLPDALMRGLTTTRGARASFDVDPPEPSADGTTPKRHKEAQQLEIIGVRSDAESDDEDPKAPPIVQVMPEGIDLTRGSDSWTLGLPVKNSYEDPVELVDLRCESAELGTFRVVQGLPDLPAQAGRLVTLTAPQTEHLPSATPVQIATEITYIEGGMRRTHRQQFAGNTDGPHWDAD